MESEIEFFFVLYRNAIFVIFKVWLTNVKAALVGIKDLRFTARTVAVAAVRLANLETSCVANIFHENFLRFDICQGFVYFVLFT